MLQGEQFEKYTDKSFVLVYDTSSECASQMYGILLKYL